MSDKKHIDRIFQEKLKDMEFTPDDGVWHKINAKLKKGNKAQKVIPLWWKIAGVAAALILLLTVGNIIFNNPDSNENIPTVVDSDVSKDENNEAIITGNDSDKNEESTESSESETTKSNIELINSKIISNNKSIANYELSNESGKNKNESDFNEKNKRSNLVTNKINSSSKKDPIQITDKTVKQVIISDDAVVNTEDEIVNSNKGTKTGDLNPKEYPEQLIEEPIQKGITSDDVLVLTEEKTKKPIQKDLEEISNVESNNPAIIEKEKIPLTEEVIVNNEDINEEEKETINRWQVYPNIAPVYFNSLGKGSSIDSQFNNNPKTGELNTSYGVNIGYALNEKLTLKTGFNALALSYDTDNVILFQNVGAGQSSSTAFRNIKVDNNDITMISATSINAQQVNTVLGANSKAAISQRLDYFEIPLEVDYKLINKKMGVNLSGGFSTFLLRNNEVVSEFDGFNTYIGEATNINDVSYSLNFGLGFNFPLSKKMSFNLDPKFKYQINTFKNTSGNFRPYIIGLYTGLNYKF